MSTGDRMRTRRKELNIPAENIAEYLGISAATVYRYEKGDIEKVPGTILEPLAKILRTTPAYLMGWEEESPTLDDLAQYGIMPITTKRIPFLGEIACGEPIFTDEDRESYVEIGTNINADFCLRCKGDSMINARILNGDIVFIRKQEMVDNGEIAAVIIGDDATLKRVFYYPEVEQLTLLAENPNNPPQVYQKGELEQVRILGKAVAFQSDVR